MEVSITVNDEPVTRDVEARMLLVHFLRDELGLTGTHWGCDTTNCGACVVLYDGEPVKSCTVLAPMADGHDVATVEHLEVDGVLDPVQQGFMECHGLQCGFCTPGMLLTARALLDRDPDPSEAGDPRGDLGPDLPVHRLRHHRAVGAVGGRAPDDGLAERCGERGDADRRDRAATSRPFGHGRMLRKEDRRLVRGRGRYTDDLQLPGMLHLAILRSPVAHARIVSVDTLAAEAHPKVRAVVTGAMLAERGLAWMPTLPGDRQPVLATDKVRFQGQEVAFVVAEDRYAARDALELIDVEYDVAAAGRRLPPGARPRHAADPRRRAGQDRQPLLRVGDRRRCRDRRSLRPGRGHARAGDRLPARAPGAARDVRRGGRLRPHRGPAHPLVDDPGAARPPHPLARFIGIEEHRIRVISPDIGGGFGNKVPIYPGYVCAIVGSMMTGKPVKWVEDRTENLVASGFARDYIMQGEIAATRDGQDPRGAQPRARRPRRLQRRRDADAVPGRLLRRVHRQLRPRGGATAR